ncbi:MULTISPECIES: ribosome hibernation-promoting factor, HPF/YfiA family [Abyssibacter]|uniref:Ribosome hibernation promoting factor n=1 Tax=Abyssibacter profundi TaxID=2182787 RepID=A0A363UM85_9GAMM|nr:ribosome-associated translation inhibitor RaiA [Abyssibacter profundi]MBV61058.1 ribosomal subunit interface protein [Nevskiales bacterium]MEC9407179.1 ribosome-associated translation inhibitor RaiA [Pseudomonadota bacterium]PWN56532.1 ribosome-associated translation inhibitor RaiA [Abyssibacter profundi]
MNLNISGHHVDLTDSLRDFVTQKLSRVERHFDHLIDAEVILTVEKIRHKAEATLHASGKNLHAEAVADDMYVAIDQLIDKLDRQTRRFKERVTDHHRKGPQRIAEMLQ